MYNYGIRGIVYDWFKSYISNRLHYAAMQHFTSDIAAVTCGVSQGSVLRPVLFLIYTNDVGKAIPEKKVKLFSDDTNLFLFDKDSKSLGLKTTKCLTEISQWFIANKLTLIHLSEICYMVFFISTEIEKSDLVSM